MDCQRIQELFSDYIDGTLEAAKGAVVEAHTAHCDPCRRDLRQLKHAVSMLHALPPLTPPAYFTHAVQARIAESSRPREWTIRKWLFPSSQGLAIRLVATAIMLIALVPPVRKPVVSAGWDLLSTVGVSRERSPQSDSTPLSSDNTGSSASTSASHEADGGDAGHNSLTGVSENKNSNQASPGAVSSPGGFTQTANIPDTALTTGIPQTLASPTALVRPAPSDLSVQFKVDGSPRPGEVLDVTTAVSGHRDRMGCSILASLSPGAHFVGGGSVQQLWSGNLIQDVPTSASALVTADHPGVYDLRVEVSAGAISAASHLFLPVGLVPAESLALDSSDSGAVDLYSALRAMVAQTARPAAVEEGLAGTQSLSIHPRDLASGLTALVAPFGCGWYSQNGIAHLVLNPEKLGHSAQVHTVGAATVTVPTTSAPAAPVSSSSNVTPGNTPPAVPASSTH